MNIGGSYNKGLPTRSLYHFELLIALVRQTGFHLAQAIALRGLACKRPIP